jgi:hypothetical protein
MPRPNGPQFTEHAAGMQVAPASVEYLDERFTTEPKAAPAGGGGGKGPSGPDNGKYTNIGDEPNNDKFKKGPKSPDWSSYGDNQGKMGKGTGDDENPTSEDYYK